MFQVQTAAEGRCLAYDQHTTPERVARATNLINVPDCTDRRIPQPSLVHWLDAHATKAS